MISLKLFWKLEYTSFKLKLHFCGYTCVKLLFLWLQNKSFFTEEYGSPIYWKLHTKVEMGPCYITKCCQRKLIWQYSNQLTCKFDIEYGYSVLCRQLDMSKCTDHQKLLCCAPWRSSDVGIQGKLLERQNWTELKKYSLLGVWTNF